jgi:hypothetical protein
VFFLTLSCNDRKSIKFVVSLLAICIEINIFVAYFHGDKQYF